MKKYKLTLLKDLPNRKAGTEVLNISEEELKDHSKYKYIRYVEEKNFIDILELADNPEWVKTEEDTRCDCETKDGIIIRDAVIGYGRSLYVILNFKSKKITTWYDHAADEGTSENLDIKFCPLCGRELKERNE